MNRSDEDGAGPHTNGTRKGGPQKKEDRLALGAEGERRAAEYLRRRGYRIIERNVRYGGVEVDLIVRRGSLVAFVEVKTRRTARYGPPELAVDAGKQNRLIRAASAWQHEVPRCSNRIRFDVVSCRLEPSPNGVRWRIRHIPDAFRAGD